MDSVQNQTRIDIENCVTNWMNDNDVPGAAVAIVDGDETVFSAGFGAADVTSNTPVTPDTLFGIGSVTKSFTALAIMQLVEDGDLSVDDPVAEHLDQYAGTDITVRDLLTHSSGLPSDGSAVVLISRFAGLDPMSVPMSDGDDFARHVRESLPERLTDEERFFYYNSGYTVLGELIEEISGLSYDRYLKDNVFTPLGMERSTFDREAFEADADRMTPCYRQAGETVEGDFPFDPLIYAPGGLLSSVEELSTYLRLQMNEGVIDRTQFLRPESVAEMHERASTRRVRMDGTSQDYGYGWMITDFLDDTLVGHGGSITVSSAYVGFLEQSNVGIAVACQTQPETHPMVVGPALLAIYEGEEPSVVPHFGLKEKAKQVVGEYESYGNIVSASIERSGGTLSLTLSTRMGDQSMALFPETSDAADLRYYTIDGSGNRIPVEFLESDDGIDLIYERWRLHDQ